MQPVSIHDGVFHLPGYVPIDSQRRLLEQCRALGKGPAGFYVPTVRGGGKMRIEMMCLGLHWNARTYRYETVRSDYDALKASFQKQIDRLESHIESQSSNYDPDEKPPHS